VLSSAKIGTSSWRYYTQEVACRATEYYLGIGEAPGRWHGRGLEQLGLQAGGRVMERQLESLFARGLHPDTGEGLGRAWRADGVTGYDLTFSAPKSVSALWALGSEDIAAAAMAAHREAVRAGLAYLDAHASLSRRGTNGTEQVGSAGLSAALFDHRTSRAGDPQLHTHALVLNKVRCADGKWRTIDGTELFAHKKTAGMIYQNALRNEMQQRLGVEFEPVSRDGQAEIRGVPTELLKLWSKRTAAIELEAAPKVAEYERLLGRTLTPAERTAVTKTAVLKTRPGKTHPQIATLSQTWAAEAAGQGWTPQRLRTAAGVTKAAARQRDDGLARGAGPEVERHAGDGPTRAEGGEPVRPGSADEPAIPDAELVLAALRAAGQRSATFSRTDVAGQIAAHLPATGLTGAEALARVEALTDQALALGEAVPVGQPIRGVTPRASDARYATLQVLQAEARVLSLAARGRAGGYGYVERSRLRTAAAAGRLDAGQLQALVALTSSGDFLTVLTAPAGAGKTSTLGAASRAWTAAGYRVLGLAPSARAAAELADATGGRADTLAKWLHNQDRLGQLPPAEQAWTMLDDRTVLIVDEASMASTLDLDRLTAAAGRAAAKVVLVGDPGQIGVINGPGGMLAALDHAGHAVQLSQIHRFHQGWERDASLQLRDGNPTALASYQREGRLHSCPDSDSALGAVFAHWTQARQDGQDALMLARTRTDVDALNQRARTAAVTNGEIAGPVTTAGDRDWQAGDLLRTRRNNRTLPVGEDHVRNGDRYRVLGPGPAGGLIVEDLRGRGRLTLPADYLSKHCEYGWASTIDAAQGATAAIGLVLVRPGMDREHLYVAMTRGRQANHVYISTQQPADPDHDHRRRPSPPDDTGTRLPTTGARRAQDPSAVGTRDGQPADAQAVAVLAQALSQTGAQDAAHTALANARREAADRAREQHERAAAEVERRRLAPRPLPPEHQRTVDLLEQIRQQHTDVRQRQDQLRATIRESQQQLDRTPRWNVARRRELTHTLTASQQQITASLPELARVDEQLFQTSRIADRHAAERRAQEAAQRPDPTLAPQRPVDLARPRGRTPSHEALDRSRRQSVTRTRQSVLDSGLSRHYEPYGRDDGGGRGR
jgi:conjugative relaxase-like TrwC/TraI family protein